MFFGANGTQDRKQTIIIGVAVQVHMYANQVLDVLLMESININ